MVELHHQTIAITEPEIDKSGGDAGIGADTQPDTAIIDDETHWICSIVGYGEGTDLQISEINHLAGFKFTPLEELGQGFPSPAIGTLVGKYRHSTAPGDDPDAAYVIVMFMGDEHPVQTIDIPTDAGQPAGNLLAGETAVYEDGGGTAFNVNRITPAVTAQNAEFHVQTPV